MLLWHKSPLVSMQLLWINLVTDSLPAIALGMEDVEKDIMDKKPKPKKEGLFANGYGIQIALQGVMFGTLSLIAYAIGSNFSHPWGGQTLTFMVLALSQIVQAYNMRSEHSLFKIGIFTNKKLNGAAFLSVALVALLLFVPPLAEIFELTRLTWQYYLAGVGLILVPFVVMEISKLFGLIKKHH